jgi:hypothetical protein
MFVVDVSYIPMRRRIPAFRMKAQTGPLHLWSCIPNEQGRFSPISNP